ncbi:MAG: hypothetical protein ACKOS8_07035 [Gemmataceae bacterium]
MVTGRWKWFFLLLAMTGIVAALLPVIFSRERQLTGDELRRAQAVWATRGPGDYTLLVRWKKQELSKEGGRPAPVVMRLKLRFRDSRLVEASRDGNFIPVDQFSDWGAEGVFGKLQGFLDRVKPKDYLVVDFAPTDGHPRHWVLVTRGGPDSCREEVDLVLTPTR